MDKVRTEHSVAYLFLVLMQLLWAINILVAHWAISSIEALIFNCLRWFLVAGILFFIAHSSIKQHKAVILKNWKTLALQSLLGISLYPVLVFYAIKYTSVINVSIITAANPILILLASSLLFGEKASPKRILGISISFLGVLFVILKGQFSELSKLSFNKGDLLQILAITTWSAYSLLLRKAKFTLPPFVFMFATSLFGAVFLLPGLIFDLSQGLYFPLSLVSISAILYVVIGGSLLGFSFWNIGVEKIGATRASIFLNLLPVFSSILAVLFLGETLYAYHLIGGLLVCAGVLLVAL